MYSTYLGGNGFDEGAVIKVDDTGAAYVGGTTSSSDFPTVNPIQGRGNRNDAFITKLSPDGAQIVYSTYLGGEDNEEVTDLALDAQKNLFVLGNIRPASGVPANDFPTVNPIQITHGGGFRDGFMSVINPSGSILLFSTYLGGDGDDFFQSIVLDPNNVNLFLGFFTDSTNFPPSIPPAVARATAAGPKQSTPITYFKCLGVWYIFAADVWHPIISPSINKDVKIQQRRESFGRGIYKAVSDLFSNASRQSTPSLMKAEQLEAGGGLDVRLDVLDQNLNITKTAFFGGSGEETISALAVDANGAVYIIGRTNSIDLPTVNPIQATHSGGDAFDGFLAVLHPQTLQPVFATYLGGIAEEALTGVTVDLQGNIYVVGETFGNFPNPTPDAIQNQLRGRTDAFLIKISPVTIPPILRLFLPLIQR